eukprot:TRINITY_DN2597_c0_g1_i1.p1 TRINITY_DN2597_c0_g1~~TRINITY_DN2597_c0_g1_i1.p1  ORF type:complete len:703 (+),score=208.02 TRINITY_DN2597_c0_g1_i1:72-2180(+)
MAEVGVDEPGADVPSMPLTGGDAECYICCSPIPAEEEYFECPKAPKPHAHTICSGCFADYVKHCCENYAVGQKIPLRCSMTKCEFFIPDLDVRRVLLNPKLARGPEIWELYQKTQVKSALNEGPKDEIPVTCHVCGYTEILVAAPPQYWEQLKRIKGIGRLLAEKASADFKEEQTKEVKERFKKIADDINKDLQLEIDNLAKEYQVYVDMAEARYAEAKKNAQEEKEARLLAASEQYSLSESEYWKVVSELHELHWGEKLENRTHANQQVRAMFTDFKMDDADFELLFDFVPDPKPDDPPEKAEELKQRKMRQLKVRAEMLNQEMRMSAPRIDDAIVEGEATMIEAFKIADDIKANELQLPTQQRADSLKLIEVRRVELMEKLKQDEEHELQFVNVQAQSLIEKRMKALDSDAVRIKLRDKLLMKVPKLDRQKSEDDEKRKEEERKKLEEEKKQAEKEEDAKKKKKKSKKKILQDLKDAAAGKDDVKIESDTHDIDIVELLDEDDDLKIDDNFATGTSQFFVCAHVSCEGAVCVRCQERLTKAQVDSHVCKEDAVQDLYTKLLEVLAEESSVKCPSCKNIWRKDLACTHMYCEKCNGYFCYHCGRSKQEVGGDFGPHNNWNLTNPEDDPDHCPMYLHYKYGDRPGNDNRMDGDAQKALDKFHQSKQKKAVAKFKETIDAALWDEMLKARFPFGIWDESRPAS